MIYIVYITFIKFTLSIIYIIHIISLYYLSKRLPFHIFFMNWGQLSCEMEPRWKFYCCEF